VISMQNRPTNPTRHTSLSIRGPSGTDTTPASRIEAQWALTECASLHILVHLKRNTRCFVQFCTAFRRSVTRMCNEACS
jgi:hypothetical protein